VLLTLPPLSPLGGAVVLSTTATLLRSLPSLVLLLQLPPLTPGAVVAQFHAVDAPLYLWLPLFMLLIPSSS
jgi:hypothetical protein